MCNWVIFYTFCVNIAQLKGSKAEAPASSEFLSLLRISEFFGFQWQNLTEILRLLPKVLQSENEAVIMITSPLYNICLQQMWLFESLLKSRGLKYTKVESTLIHQYTVAMEVTLFTLPWYAFFQRLQVQWLTLACQKRRSNSFFWCWIEKTAFVFDFYWTRSCLKVVHALFLTWIC